MRGMVTLPQGNQELSGQRQSWKIPGELGVSKSIECVIIPFSALICHCWLGDRKGLSPITRLRFARDLWRFTNVL